MKRFSRKFEQLFTAITFAESGEFESAREILTEEMNDRICETNTVRKTVEIPLRKAKEQKA